MGIQGLTTYISNQSKHLFENYLLYDTNIVIDGNSLLVQLYQHHAILKSNSNSVFGGDYDVYSKHVEKFFNNLRKCNITPYVIFDGGYENKKLNTVLKRLSCRIFDASRVTLNNQNNILILPILLKDVFVEVMSSMSVKFVFCEYEADQEIAVVARYLDCPVLSYDSDFYIYNVKYIPFPTLIHKVSTKMIDENKRISYMKCKIYKVEKFLNYNHLNNDVLPLLATLLGNDYVKRHVFAKFFHNLSESKSKKRNAGQCKIFALIQWLQNESFASALNKVLERFKISQRSYIERNIKESCDNYLITFCKSLNYFDLNADSLESNYGNEINSQEDNFNNDVEGSDIDDDDDSDEEDSTSSSDELIPYEITNKLKQEISCEWIKQILNSGRISPKFYDLIHMSMYIGSPQVEDFSKRDSNLSALPILLFSCKLLKDFTEKPISYIGRKDLRKHRMEINTTDVNDDVKHYYENRELQPNHDVFFHFLEKTLKRDVINDVRNMPEDIQMIILTIVWITHSAVDHVIPTESNIISIILSYIIMLLVKLHTNKEYTQFEFHSKYSKFYKEWAVLTQNTSIDINKEWSELYQNLSYEDSMLAINELIKFFQTNKSLIDSPKLFRREYMHFYSEYQCCLQQLNYLNILTSCCFKPCVYSQTYNGTFIYNMHDNLRKRNNPTNYVAQLLKKSPNVLSYFLKLMNIFGYSPNDLSVPENVKISTRKKKRKPVNKNNVNDDEIDNNPRDGDPVENEDNDVYDVNNKFYLLNVL